VWTWHSLQRDKCGPGTLFSVTSVDLALSSSLSHSIAISPSCATCESRACHMFCSLAFWTCCSIKATGSVFKLCLELEEGLTVKQSAHEPLRLCTQVKGMLCLRSLKQACQCVSSGIVWARCASVHYKDPIQAQMPMSFAPTMLVQIKAHAPPPAFAPLVWLPLALVSAPPNASAFLCASL